LLSISVHRRMGAISTTDTKGEGTPHVVEEMEYVRPEPVSPARIEEGWASDALAAERCRAKSAATRESLAADTQHRAQQKEDAAVMLDATNILQTTFEDIARGQQFQEREDSFQRQEYDGRYRDDYVQRREDGGRYRDDYVQRREDGDRYRDDYVQRHGYNSRNRDDYVQRDGRHRGNYVQRDGRHRSDGDQRGQEYNNRYGSDRDHRGQEYNSRHRSDSDRRGQHKDDYFQRGRHDRDDKWDRHRGDM
jgi:hypothetical protein